MVEIYQSRPEARPRPATFDVVLATCASHPLFQEDPFKLRELGGVLDEVSSLKEAGPSLVQRFGKGVVEQLATHVIGTLGECGKSPIRAVYPEAVTENAIRCMRKVLVYSQNCLSDDSFVMEETEEITQEETPKVLRSKTLPETSWKPRKSGLPRGVGSHSNDDRPRKLKRHNGRFVMSSLSN